MTSRHEHLVDDAHLRAVARNELADEGEVKGLDRAC
jgi:hypothetical protein